MITLQNVSKVFGTGVAGLSEINLHIDKGEFVFLVGHTGSGKTTLLRMLIKEVVPTEGSVIVGGWDLNKLPPHKVPHLRKKIGVIFQDLKLLSDRTIFENIMLPLQVSGINKTEAQNRAEELLEHVGISAHRDKFPIQLSGGELQRAAIARALTLSPDILLADEPTGNLDSATAFGIVSLLSKINQHGTTIIMATHNMEIVESLGERVIMLEKGKLIKDEKAKKKKSHEPKESAVSKEEKKSHEEHKKHDHEKVSKHTEEVEKEAESKEESATISPEDSATVEEEVTEQPKKKKFSFFNRKKE